MFTVIAACFTCRVVVRVEVVVRVLVDVEVVVVRRNLPDKHLYKRHALSNCTQQNYTPTFSITRIYTLPL